MVYGWPWKAGDIITSIIDLDDGEIMFLQNGDFLGVAFEDINKDAVWFPSISMASEQGCTVAFGGVSQVQSLPSDVASVSPCPHYGMAYQAFRQLTSVQNQRLSRI